MSPPVLVANDQGESNASTVTSSPSLDCISHTGSGLKERNYLGLSDCSSVDSSTVPSLSDEKKDNLTLKATELRLGLPGSQSPERDTDPYLLCSPKLDEKQLFPLLPTKGGICTSSLKTVISGNKRGFSDTMDGLSEVRFSPYNEGKSMFYTAESGFPQPVVQGKFPGNSGMNVLLSPRPAGAQPTTMKEMPTKVLQERPCATNGTGHNCTDASVGASTPASK